MNSITVLRCLAGDPGATLAPAAMLLLAQVARIQRRVPLPPEILDDAVQEGLLAALQGRRPASAFSAEIRRQLRARVGGEADR